MEDEQLYYLANSRKIIDEKIKRYRTDLAPIDHDIIAELQDRRTKRIESEDGLKITLTAGNSTEYPYAKFVQEYGEEFAATLRPDTIDKDKLADAIMEGSVDPARVAQLVITKPKKPYISVT